jgi:hypothetical protein
MVGPAFARRRGPKPLQRAGKRFSPCRRRRPGVTGDGVGDACGGANRLFGEETYDPPRSLTAHTRLGPIIPIVETGRRLLDLNKSEMVHTRAQIFGPAQSGGVIVRSNDEAAK